MRKIALIIAAGGTGSRLGSKLPKQFLDIDGSPMIVRSILPFMGIVQKLVISITPGYEDYLRKIMPDDVLRILTIVPGGQTRYESVKNALELITDDYELVAIHDAARPYVEKSLINSVINIAAESGAAIPVVPLVDSIRKIMSDGSSSACDRKEYAFVQTPQIFKTEILKKAYKQPYSQNITDDASLVEALGIRVYTVDGSSANRKITFRSDL